MGSKKIKRLLFFVIFLFVALVGAIAAANLDLVKRKLGLGTEETVQETAALEEEKDGGQRGNDLSAFLRDETFFDPEVKFKSIETYSGRSVSLMMSSVAKDLRIMIVDSVGRLVTGTPFVVEVRGAGEYTDTDEDGIIYIDGLRAGEYSVSLKETEGFNMPNTLTSIRVKQEIEYRTLDDIEYLIMTEDEIDAEKEDKEVKGAEEAADGSENTQLQFASGNARLGIDVSKWNKTIDWDEVKEAGIEFAIIRCGYRGASSGALVLDPMYGEKTENHEK